MTGRRVLVVDDDDDIRMLAAMSLGRVGGFDVRSCSCGGEALEVAADWLPEAVLMDVRMPGQDGPTTSQLLAAGATTAHIPVIFLTASLRGEDKAALSALGAAGVLSKPFDPMTLPHDVADLLGWT
jgi:CheY-like chemotaxis protein